MRKKKYICILAILGLLALASCGSGTGQGHELGEGDTLALKYATNLQMIDYGDFIKADFRNPWDTTRILQTYLLVPRDKEIPASLPKGTVVRTPIEKSVVYTSVHSNLICELGAIDAIAGVCDSQYMRNSELLARIGQEVTDCGSTMAPNIEKILMLKPDAILLSAYENSNDHNKVGQIGIPIIDCTDYMETSPLGRAEWMKFFGRLYGQGALADSLFDAAEASYLELRDMANSAETKPLVLTEMIYGGTWDVPAAYSTAGVLIEDAGGKNPFDAYKKSGSVKLAPEEVLYTAKDADFWLLKYAQQEPLTLRQLGKDNAIYTKFRPYAQGEVYGIDTNTTTYFDDAAFHPHWILAEYVELFHPELGEVGGNHHYYQKLSR